MQLRINLDITYLSNFLHFSFFLYTINRDTNHAHSINNSRYYNDFTINSDTETISVAIDTIYITGSGDPLVAVTSVKKINGGFKKGKM